MAEVSWFCQWRGRTGRIGALNVDPSVGQAAKQAAGCARSGDKFRRRRLLDAAVVAASTVRLSILPSIIARRSSAWSPNVCQPLSWSLI